MDIDIGFWLTVLVAITGTTWLVEKRLRKTGKNVPEKVAESLAFLTSLLPVFLVVLIVRSFLFEPFTIPSGSMIPTLKVHDFVLVNKFSYGLRLPVIHTVILETGKPEHGDIMVFRYPKNPSQNYIKRVVGLPGDKIELRGEDLMVNDDKVPRTLVDERVQVEECLFRGAVPVQVPVKTWSHIETRDGKSYTTQRRSCILRGQKPAIKQDGRSWVVPEGHYFVMGDNRDNSQDSRFWGFVPESHIVGRASIIWMHWQGFTSLPRFSRNGVIDKVETE